MSFSKNFETVEGVNWQAAADQVNKLEYGSWSISVDGTVTEHEGYDLNYLGYLGYLVADEVDEPGITFNGWEPVRGITGQHGYNGAIMHPSECIDIGLCRGMAEDGGLFRVEYVTELDDDETEDETGLVGWCLLKRVA